MEFKTYELYVSDYCTNKYIIQHKYTYDNRGIGTNRIVIFEIQLII